MMLYLVQHGKAKTESEDPQRGLTPLGEEEIHKVAAVLKRLEATPTRIYHSGKLRAEQTASILGKALGLPVEQANGLAPNDDPRPWVDRIQQGEGETMIVGHLPFLERLASLLIGGDEGLRPLRFRFAAVNGLERKPDGKWAVCWVITPEMASALGEPS